ncbi:MAG TPA: hypothetical protein PLV45_01860 [bacterium]|nr:hypothetical protein [bacterium]
MSGYIYGFAVASIIWAVVSLLIQWVIAWGGGRKDHSERSGVPQKGMIYNFTVAMLPSHKETVRLHPMKFAAGILMHTGAFIAIFSMILLLAFGKLHPVVTVPGTVILSISLIAAVFLLYRRMTDKTLQAINTPDDVCAIVSTTVYILLALLLHIGIISASIFLFTSALFFLYFPLGKLRHALFFFVARGDYGRRLGYRGVYPVPHKAKQDNSL